MSVLNELLLSPDDESANNRQFKQQLAITITTVKKF